MKRKHPSLAWLAAALITVLVVSCTGTPTPTKPPATNVPAQATTEATVAATSEATAEATDEIIIEPANPTEAPTLPSISGTPNASGGINGTPIPNAPALAAPTTLEELKKAYPDLGPFLDKLPVSVGDWNMADLYKQIVTIYNEKGASGLAVFLEESGILDKLGLPLSYLDLLTAFDKGGFDAVKKLAKTRQLINSKEEIVGYLVLQSPAVEASVRSKLTDLGVTTYRFIPEREELEIGIPLAVLGQFQTPGNLIKYLSQIANVEGVVGFRAPAPVVNTGLTIRSAEGTGAKTIGADKWHAAGITGKGIKIGILDMGFHGVKSQLGGALPDKVETNLDIDEMDSQDSDHGTACAMVVHTVAPDAELYLASFDGTSQDSFIEALQWLSEAGVKVINFSVGSAVGPRDGSFGDAVLVDAFVRDTGILWVNAAGNYATSHTVFKFNEGEKKFHLFGTNDQGEDVYLMPFIAGEPETSIVMNWNGNWNGGEKSQYNFTILNKDGDEIAAGNETIKGRKGDYPYQATVFEAEPGTIYFMAIQRARGTKANVIDIFIPNGLLVPWAQVPSYSVTTPGDSDTVLTVGATGLIKDDLEEYSSQGPTTDDRLKPDISAPTGENVPGYEEDGFIGTSGAAPMVSGAAGLVFQKFPDMTQEEAKAFLVNNVIDLGEKGADPLFGSGRLQLKSPDGTDPDNPNNQPSTDTPTAEITDLKAKFGVKVGSDKGVQVKVSFDLANYKGKSLIVGVLFFSTEGQKIASADADYDINGTVGTGKAIKVKTKQTSFKDVSLFIPNAVFKKVKDKELIFKVVILDATDTENLVVLAESEPTTVKVRK